MTKDKKTALILLAIITLVCGSAAAEESQEIKKNILKEKQHLEEIKGKIKGEKKALLEAKKAKRDILKELGSIEADIEKTRDMAIKTGGKLDRLRVEVKRKDERSKRLKREIAKQEQWLKKRLVSLYKFGSLGTAKVIFSSDSYMTLRERSTFMQLILKNDISTIEDYNKKITAVQKTLEELKKDRKEAEDLQARLSLEREKTKKRRQNKKELLASINRSKELHEQALKEMETSSREIGNLISNFEGRLLQESQYEGGNSFTALKGRLDFPAEGDIVGFFGKRKDPKFNTIIFQKGIDIAVSEGAEVRAVFDGKVLYADWFRGYGKIIIIDHGEGFYSLSAHLSKLAKKVNDSINKGETIALSGDTGSLKGPYLYFEIRKKGKPVDPLDWLKIPLGKSNNRANSGRKR